MKPFKIIFSLFAVFLAGVAASAAAALHDVHISPLATSFGIGSVSVASEFLTRNAGPGHAFTAFELTQIVEALGDYCRDENKDELLSSLMLGFVPEDTFTIMDDVLDEMPLPQFDIQDIVKPGHNPNFEPTADAFKFDARIVKVRDCKIDLLLVPKELEKTYLGKYKRKRDDVMEIPFEQYILDHIRQKANEEMRMQALHRGTYNPSGTAAIDTITGIDTLLKLERDDEDSVLFPAVTGVITEANVIDKMLIVYDAINPALKEQPTIMPVSSTIFDWAIRKYEPILNASIIAADRATLENGGLRNSFALPGTNCIVKREPGKGNSQFLYCTSKKNLFYATNTGSPANNVRIQEFDRTIKLMFDFKAGTQIGMIHKQMIAVNDQN